MSVVRHGRQRWWLIAYWITAGLSTLLLVVALVGDGQPVALTNYLGVGLGTVACVSGAVMATRLTRHGVSDVRFDEATAGMRVITVGWLLFAGIMVSLAIYYTAPGRDTSAAPAAAVASTDSLTGTLFGAAALFAVVGPGYSAYRSAMHESTSASDVSQ